MKSSVRWFLNPYLQIFLSVLLNAASQILLKIGADSLGEATVTPGYILTCLSSAWVWSGILCMITSLLSWLYALRTVPLIIAFNLAGLLHVIVPLLSWAALGEQLSPLRIIGIALVFTGVLIVAKPVIKVEEL